MKDKCAKSCEALRNTCGLLWTCNIHICHSLDLKCLPKLQYSWVGHMRMLISLMGESNNGFLSWCTIEMLRREHHVGWAGTPHLSLSFLTAISEPLCSATSVLSWCSVSLQAHEQQNRVGMAWNLVSSFKLTFSGILSRQWTGDRHNDAVHIDCDWMSV